MATFAQRVPKGISAPCNATSRRSTVVAAARRAEESVSPVLRAKQCAGALAVAMLLATASPDAAEAARSGGRTGGSNFSRAKSAPPPARSQPNVTNNTVVVAPSPFGFSPFGFSPFGFGGFGYGMGGGMVMGAPMGGLSLILDFILIGVVLSAITGVIGAVRGGGQKKKDDDW